MDRVRVGSLKKGDQFHSPYGWSDPKVIYTVTGRGSRRMIAWSSSTGETALDFDHKVVPVPRAW